jgi:hypothetical protein
MRHFKKNSICIACVLLIAAVCAASLSASSFSAGVFGQYRVVDNDLFNVTYGDSIIEYGLCLNYRFAEHWGARLEGAYSKIDGNMTLKQDPITFTAMPLKVGLRYLFSPFWKETLEPYLGFGVGLVFYTEELPQRFDAVSGSEPASHIELGTLVHIGDTFFLDLNVRYNTLEIQPRDEAVNLPGLSTGLGLNMKI